MNSSPLIAICIPSRGMMHSRTIQDIMLNALDYDCVFIMAHGKPQPDAQNYLTELALAENPDFIWFVDDDMQLPPGILKEMLALNSLVVVADYPVAERKPTVHIRDGKFESAGMGCVLVKPEVFTKLEKPYFRTDTDWILEGSELKPYPTRADLPRHGGHDVDFFQRLLKVGIEPAIVKTKAGQYYLEDDRIKKWGNDTAAKITTWRLPE